LLTLIGSGCRKTRDVSTLSAENPFVYAYTSGVISKTDPIRVRFAQNVAQPDEIGQEAPGVISLSPGVKGKITWEDASTLRLEPNQELSSGTTYDVSVNVKKVIPDAKGKNANFDFQFHTREQHYQVDLEGMRSASATDYSKQSLKGAVYTSDAAASTEVEKILEAQQGGNELKVDWKHSGDQLVHYFTVKSVNRGKQPSEVKLAYDGNAIGVKEDKSETYKIPQVDKFTVMDAEVVQLPEQYIRIVFSDPLNKSQNLDGLISIDEYEGTLRFIIEDNTVRVYPDQTLNGDYRVRVASGVQNTKGNTFAETTVWDVTFEEIKPDVRLVGQGVILPNSEGLMFPFEAVGLKAVDIEIFKIFNNNILQFLQDNSLDGEYDLYKVGRVVMQKKVNLSTLSPNAQAGRWSRYALDLGKLIKADEQAIYQVRIGFRAEYAAVACMAELSASTDLNADPFSRVGEDEEDALESIMDNYYGYEGYFEGYEYDNRDNPCTKEYYNSDHFVQRNVISSNLGLIAKKGGNRKLMVIVSDLRSTDPISGAQVEVFDRQSQSIGKGSSNGEGIADIAYKGRPFAAIVTHNGQRGYVRLEDGESLSLSKFDVDGSVTQKGLKGFLYGERGVWRPGDSVFLNFMIEDREKRLPESYPITMELYNARGQLQEKRTTSRTVGGIYPLYFATHPDAPTGNWRVKVKAGGASFEKILKIETVKPNRIRVDLNTGSENELYATDGKMNAELQADWLTGSPASGLKAVVEVQLRESYTQFAKYPSYSFDDPARRLTKTEPRMIFDNVLDGNGHAKVSATLLEEDLAPGMLNASFQTRVFEKGGDFSTDNITVKYSPYNSYAGIEIPRNKYGSPQFEVNQSNTIQLVNVDKNGKPLTNRRLTIGLYKVEWRWWWDQYQQNEANYNSGEHVGAVKTAAVNTNAKGEATWNFKANAWGRYLIRVCDPESGHCTGGYIYLGTPWYEGDDEGDNFREAAAMLSFRADKPKYKVGESVTLTIPGGKNGRVLVSLETGTKILKTFWAKSVEGENTITFKTTPDMSPTVYANVALIQPHGQVANDLPIRLYGVAPIAVEDAETLLSPSIECAAEFRPESTVSIEVAEKAGKAMAYSLAIVDEGLLGLTRFKTPNPHAAFYAREALGVQTWDIYDKVLGAFAGELESILSIGGDGAIDPSALNNTANRFKPMVVCRGPFQLAKGRSNKHQIKIPNYIGAVRVMVVAAQDNAYGSTDKSVPVRNPLMVRSTLPRTISPGDQFELPVNVFVTDSKITNVQVKVSESTGLVTVEDGDQSMSFSRNNSDQITGFKVKVKDKVGIAKFKIMATGGGASSSEEIEIDVRNPNPYQTKVFSEVVEVGKTWEQPIELFGTAGTRSTVLEVSNIPPLNLGERLGYLLSYPYGCIEQTTSAAFPQLFVGNMMELNEERQQQVAENIKAAIERVKNFQTNEGGFSYWPGGNGAPDHWSTSYVGHFLVEAKAKGYDVPQNVLKDWAKFQKKVSRMWDSKLSDYGFWSIQGHELSQAYRLYTLALAGEADLASMNRLRENDKLNLSARWRLAAAYALAGKPEVAKELIKDKPTEVPEYSELSYTYGSGMRDRAMILETLVLLKDMKKAGALVQYISKGLSSQSWYSTQTVAYSLMAVSKYLGDEKATQAFSFSYSLSGGQSTSANSKNAVMQINLPTGSNNTLVVKNTSKAKLFVRVIQKGQPTAGQESAQSNDLGIAVSYTDMSGKPLDPGNLPQGKDFIAEVKITHPNARPIPYMEMALTQTFPSGWEISNSRMTDIESTSQSGFDYQDIRDDRVNTFFDLSQSQNKSFRVRLNAAYPGRYYLPAVSCAAMYDNSISASTKGMWVQVTAR
jgi:hypothetical protein